VSGELTVIPVGAGSPIIIAKNRQSHKPAPAQGQNNRSIVDSPIAFEFLALTNPVSEHKSSPTQTAAFAAPQYIRLWNYQYDS